MDAVEEKTPYVAAISGVKNSGKTTFLEHLIPCLRRRGKKVAVIKHDGHEFEPDVPGTDSFRLRLAGAEGVAVYSGGRWMVVSEEPGDLRRLIRQFSDFDIILLEGQKYSDYPKIELVRRGVSETPVCDPATLLAIATDIGLYIGSYMPEAMAGVERIGLDDYERAAEILCKNL